MPKKPAPKDLLNLHAQHERERTKTKIKPSLVAVDYGEKFCGLAVAPDGVTILPAAVINTSGLKSALQSLVDQYQVKCVIFGLPLASDGHENHVCKQIRKVVDQLKKQNFKLKFELINERFSSQSTLSPTPERVDDLAAMRILEFYLAQK